MKVPGWAKFSKIGIREYIAAFCVTVFLAVMMLAVAAFLPQTVISNHVVDSLWVIERDIANNYIFDNSPGSKIDVGTDLIILETSLTTNDNYLGSILTNPMYDYDDLDGWREYDELIARLAYGTPSDDVWFYARYWMGFRVIMRLALTFFTYAQLKRYLSFLFLSLFVATVCGVSKHTNSKIAFFYALSIVLIRPHVMATSMQLTSCFFVAFAAMLLVPWLHRHGKWEGIFFMELGMLTMYFDFYTVPLVTLGFPLLYLCILKQEEGAFPSWKNLLRNVAVWFAGYGFMWIAKLTLTTMLTSVNAFSQGFKSFFSRVGIRKDPELTQFYSVKTAFEAVREVIFSDTTGMIVYLLGVAMILAVVLCKVLRGQTTRQNLRSAAPYLLFAALPLVWFVITKQPVAIHAYFQYRTIALTHWAAGVFLYYLLPAKSKALTDAK